MRGGSVLGVERGVEPGDRAGIRVQAQVHPGVADDADAIDGWVEIEAEESSPNSVGVNGAPTATATPVAGFTT